MTRLIPWGAKLDHDLQAGPYRSADDHEVNAWLARVARGLVAMRWTAGGRTRKLPRDLAFEFLRKACARERVPHRDVFDAEINRALDFAERAHGGTVSPRAETPTATAPGTPATAKPGTPASPGVLPRAPLDHAAIERLAQHPAPFKLADGDPGIEARDVFHALYAGEELLAGGPDIRRVFPLPARDLHQYVSVFQFICPNPLKGHHALSKEGRFSVRCESNVDRVLYRVVEFDRFVGEDKYKQCGLIGYLATLHPLRLVVDSAGKSLHAWFTAADDPQVDYDFYTVAVSLGADATKWTPCGWVRMPGGIRPRPDGNRVQRILYLSE
jgi:hypothetical protein